MFTVIKASEDNLISETVKICILKTYKSKKAALKYAYKKNQMITTQVLGETYFVHDQKTREFLKAEIL